MKHKMLVDLKVALNNGYYGIAQENRLVFKILAQVPEIDLSGLLVSNNPGSVFSKYKSTEIPFEVISQGNRFLHEALGHELLFKHKILNKLKLNHLFALQKKKFKLFSLHPTFKDTIWRNTFSQSIEGFDRTQVLENKFYFTDLTNHHLRVAAYFRKQPFLNTENHHIALFYEPLPISISPKTTKIVRFHDAIPMTEPDFAGSLYSFGKLNNLKTCARDSYFICNSQPTLDHLLQLYPELEKKAYIVPSVIASNYKKVSNISMLKKIISNRLGTLVAPERLESLQAQLALQDQFKYIFSLAALDPKKNHMTLIRAWEKVHYTTNGGVKLILAANAGWLNKEIESLLKPHIEAGNIIHLSNLSNDELPYLFSHAQAFVFPSYTEGFGLPPLEAMQCECPTIVSDIPAHRWVLGDAALYCNPYNADSLADTLLQLVLNSDAETLKQTLAERGLARVKRYMVSALVPQWQGVLAKITRTNPAG